MGNKELNELICTTHGLELRGGWILEGWWGRVEGD